MSRSQIAECLRKIEGVRDALAAQIATLPDNRGIRRLSDRCFIIRFKDLTVTTTDAAGNKHTANNWCPRFHDFKGQYRKIIDLLNGGAPQDCYHKLEKAIIDGRLEDREKTKLHPGVIAHLAALIGTPVSAEGEGGNI